MNPKTKKTTNLPRSKLGIAGAVFSLWAIAVYSAGLLNPLQASQDTTLKVNGVQNHVQYLTSLVITGTNGNVEFKYDQATNSVQALGALNMQNIVIEDKNAGNAASNPSAVILGGTGNTNNGQNSVIIGGERTVNGGQNNLLINTPKSNAQSFNTAIIRGEWVTTNGKNIFVNNANNAGITGDNIFINGSSSSERGNNVAIFGSKVTNTKSNVFIFNGNNAEFNPNLDSAFYANGKVAINGSNAVGTLHVHGGVMVQNRESDYKSPNQSGIIALFSRGVQKGLCGYDGKKRRVPLSESARLYGLCAPRGDIVGTRPANAVSNWETILPQVWNQQNWTWEARKWIYGSDQKPGYFLCNDGFVPYPTDALGKTGVWCKLCETAKKGDLNCPEKASPKPEPTPVQPPVPVQPTCPPEGTWNGTSCVKPLKCLSNLDTNGTFSDGVQTYNGSTWKITTHCTLNCNSGYEKKTGTDWREYCAKLETYTWKCANPEDDENGYCWVNSCPPVEDVSGNLPNIIDHEEISYTLGGVSVSRGHNYVCGQVSPPHVCNNLNKSACESRSSCLWHPTISSLPTSNVDQCINSLWNVVSPDHCNNVKNSCKKESYHWKCNKHENVTEGEDWICKLGKPRVVPWDDIHWNCPQGNFWGVGRYGRTNSYGGIGEGLDSISVPCTCRGTACPGGNGSALPACEWRRKASCVGLCEWISLSAWISYNFSLDCVNANGRVVDESKCKFESKPVCGPVVPTCSPTEHLENGACVSNTKTVSCDARWVVSPANGKVNNTEQVSVTRSETAQLWSKPAKCDVSCNAGYEKKNGKCEKKIKLIRELKQWDSIGWDCGLQWAYIYRDITSECDTEPPKKAPSYLWEQVDAGEYRENGECWDFAIEWWAAWGGPSGITYSCYWEGVESK